MRPDSKNTYWDGKKYNTKPFTRYSFITPLSAEEQKRNRNIEWTRQKRKLKSLNRRLAAGQYRLMSLAIKTEQRLVKATSNV